MRLTLSTFRHIEFSPKPYEMHVSVLFVQRMGTSGTSPKDTEHIEVETGVAGRQRPPALSTPFPKPRRRATTWPSAAPNFISSPLLTKKRSSPSRLARRASHREPVLGFRFHPHRLPGPIVSSSQSSVSLSCGCGVHRGLPTAERSTYSSAPQTQ